MKTGLHNLKKQTQTKQNTQTNKQPQVKWGTKSHKTLCKQVDVGLYARSSLPRENSESMQYYVDMCAEDSFFKKREVIEICVGLSGYLQTWLEPKWSQQSQMQTK